ncbi:MAG TPA: ROK family transcriptional regulator [Candidatus Sulfomarinibacteraceae bacterium]|nr:ROK family transcriptional regulator [Candidatus Sulfomarinibacteraceae bacterium]
MKKATRQQTRNHNTRLVLKTIYEQNGISRADIARATSLTRPTVSTIVSDLLEEELIAETGLGPSAGGKPPTLLEVQSNAQRLLCIDLGSRQFRGALVNLRGGITERAELPLQGKTGDEALNLVYQLIDHLRAASPVSILGIGIGTPGLVDPHSGVVRQAVNLDWRQLPLKSLLESRYKVSAYVANDSQAAALGEFTFGVGHDSRNLILIRIGQGIGAGIVLNGHPLYGDGFAAGEIGHVVVADDGPRCSCGNQGCLETVAGTRSFLLAAEEILGRDASWSDFVAAYEEGRQQALHQVDSAGRYLGTAIANLVAAFNVHHIVLSGRVSQFGERLLQAAQTAARRRALPALVDETTLSYSVLGTDVVILGSSALVLRHELGIV